MKIILWDAGSIAFNVDAWEENKEDYLLVVRGFPSQSAARVSFGACPASAEQG